MNNSVTFSTFTVLFKQHLYLVPKYFHHSKRKFKPIKNYFRSLLLLLLVAKLCLTLL